MPKENPTRKLGIQRANLNQYSRPNRPIINSTPIHQPGKYKNIIFAIFFKREHPIFEYIIYFYI